MPKLSVIIPTLNEENNLYFPRILDSFLAFNDVEIIVSDGGSRDNTLSLISSERVKILQKKTSSRAERLNWGMREATGEMILLHHPRSHICHEGIESLLDNYSHLSWGGFTHSFDMNHPLLRFTSWYSNNIRGTVSGIVYLDHCLFLGQRMAMEIGELPPVEIFEDTILSLNLLKRYGRPAILPHRVTTSAVRFRSNGMLKQALMNQYLKIKYLLGADHRKMNEFYERETRLNSDDQNN
jgi:hypothetical protein